MQGAETSGSARCSVNASRSPRADPGTPGHGHGTDPFHKIELGREVGEGEVWEEKLGVGDKREPRSGSVFSTSPSYGHVSTSGGPCLRNLRRIKGKKG